MTQKGGSCGKLGKNNQDDPEEDLHVLLVVSYRPEVMCGLERPRIINSVDFFFFNSAFDVAGFTRTERVLDQGLDFCL